MAGTRTRRVAGSEQSRTARAAALAEELHHECTLLLELYVSISSSVESGQAIAFCFAVINLLLGLLVA